MLPIDVRRAERRAWAIVCSFFLASVIGLGSLGAGDPETPAVPPPDRAPAAARAGHDANEPDANARDTSAHASTPMPASRVTIAGPEGKPIEAYPPLPEGSTTRRPLVLMLHGMCGEALATCDRWSDGGRERAWLVCPTGNGACGGVPDWRGTGEEKAKWIDAGLEALEAEVGAHVDHAQGDVISGFSRGAFVARDVVYARPGRYRGAILIGAALTPDAARFKAAGIRRVVLAAGDFDGARPTMQRAAAMLTAAGVPARYVSLGPIGHQLPRDLETRFREALAWVRASDPS